MLAAVAGRTEDSWLIRGREAARPQQIQAVTQGHVSTVGSLARKGRGSQTTAAGGVTALLAASVAGHTEVAEELVSRGADPNARDEGGLTPLIGASVNSRTDPKVAGREGITINALHAAAANGNAPVVRTLVQLGAEVAID